MSYAIHYVFFSKTKLKKKKKITEIVVYLNFVFDSGSCHWITSSGWRRVKTIKKVMF